jgi:putative toxin-antitoxin system antitoxin component (TIGR02293 family)
MAIAESDPSMFRAYPLSNDLKMAELVLLGLPSTVLKQLANALGLKPSGLAPIVNISEKTMLRRVEARSKLKPDESERVARLMRVYVRTVEVFEDREKAKTWLGNPLRVLGGKSPIELLMSEQGAREVEQVLGRLENGVFA